MGLAPIPIDTYTDFTVRMFSERGKSIEAEVIHQIYEKYEGYTWFVHMLMNELFSMTNRGDTCSLDYVPHAEDAILRLQEVSYESTLAMLPAKQKQVLFAIASEGLALNVTSSTFIKKHSLPSPSSLQTALKALIDKSIVMRTEQGYRLEDFFFAEWLRK